MKQCPYCRCEIQDIGIFCAWCGGNLVNSKKTEYSLDPAILVGRFQKIPVSIKEMIIQGQAFNIGLSIVLTLMTFFSKSEPRILSSYSNEAIGMLVCGLVFALHFLRWFLVSNIVVWLFRKLTWRMTFFISLFFVVLSALIMFIE